MSAPASALLLFELPAGTSCGRDLACFHELLEAAQVAACLDTRLALEELGDEPPDRPARRIVRDRGAHDGAAGTGIDELDAATVGDVGAGRRLPVDLAARNILRHYRLP